MRLPLPKYDMLVVTRRNLMRTDKVTLPSPGGSISGTVSLPWDKGLMHAS